MAAVAGCFAGCNKETDNTVPIACFEFTPTSGTTTTVFQFDASGSSDAETPVEQLQVRWDWENNGTWTPFSTIKTVAHQFETAGFYSVSLEVMDAGELTDCITYTVMVTSGGKEKDGTFTDPRDGHTYGYKVIGSQIWMCENLAYLPEVSPPDSGSFTQEYYYVYGYVGSSVSEAKSQANYTTYGVLYNWPAAMNGAASSNAVPSGIPGVCPPGWHLPSDAEWTVLTDFLTSNGYGFGGSGEDIGKSLAYTSGWTTYNAMNSIGYGQTGNNASGFSALPGGRREDFSKRFDYISGYAYFWSSTLGESTRAWTRSLSFQFDVVYRYTYGTDGLSVRCVRN